MKKLLAVVLFCLPAFGQAAYSGLGLHSGSATYAASGSSCAAPNFCAYAGTDVIPWGTIPDFGGATNNNATAYDTSYLGHTNFDGSTFSNSAFLSPITRVTDAFSKPTGPTSSSFVAGMGGSGAFTLTNTNTTLVAVDAVAELVCVFNPATGHCLSFGSMGTVGHRPAGGIFITTNMNTAGGGSSTSVQDFGSISFSLTDPTVLYSFGTTSDISNALSVTPYTLDPATGMFTVGSTIVDFAYGLPAQNASAWTTSHSYGYGDYVIHALATSEMVDKGSGGGVWVAGATYQIGDIVTSQSGVHCMYVAHAVTTGISGVTSPPFDTTAPCGHETQADNGVSWGGTNSTAQFVYQNTGAAGTSSGSTFQWIATPTTLATDGSIASTTGRAVLTSASNPFLASQVGQTISVSGAGNSAGITPLYTTMLSYQSAGQVTLSVPALHTTSGATVALTGHPDNLSATVSDSNGIVWTNSGTAYIPASASQVWHALGGISRDTAYGGFASKYGIAISTNSYGRAPTYNGVEQATGIWAAEYDGAPNIYHLLNTLTGIWTDWLCSSGSGYACPRTATTVGALTAISNNATIGQACPFYLHGLKIIKSGLYAQITPNPEFYSACNPLTDGMVWRMIPSSFDTADSLQSMLGGLNHSAQGTNKFIVFTGGSTFGFTAGVFTTLYNDMDHVSGPLSNLSFGTFLQPLANQSTSQTTPPGCYVTVGSTIKNPDCNLSEVVDSHLSWAGDPGTDNYPACGTSYNYATLGPAVNAWQNMETCYPTAVTQSVSSLPIPSTLPSFGSPWQFTHSFATGTSLTFSTQFQISQYSQDANWLFWGSDWNCQNGSTTGSAPTVWSSGTYYQMLVAAAVPANPSSLCGLPWEPATSYTVGNTINPIEGTSGSGGVDDVFQAIYVNGNSGPASTLPGKQPKCGSTSCFANTNPPLCNGLSCASNPTSTPFTAGDTVCDNQNYNGTTQLNAINPTPPYSTSCPNGVVWQDLGPQDQRGDVFAVNLGNSQ